MKNVYVLLDSKGRTCSEMLKVLKSLLNDFAKKHVGHLFVHAMEVLKTSDVYVCEYGDVNVHFAKVHTVPYKSRNYKFQGVEFVNQEHHDMTGQEKSELFQ